MNLESCPSWPKEHDWKSCNRSKPVRGFESLALRQNEKQVARPAFCFGKKNKGIRTRREQTKSAEENSPVDCFRRRGQGAERREGAQACAEKTLALRRKSTVVFIELRCFLLLSKDLSNDIINYNMLNFFGGGSYTFQIQANAKRRYFRIHKRNV